MSSLASNPGGSGIYGQPGSNNNAEGDVLDIFNKIKDRELQDYQNKGNIDLNLKNQQANLRRVFDPSNGAQQPATMGQPMKQPMNVVQANDPSQVQNPNQIPAEQQAQLGIRNKELDVNSQRLAQQGKFSQQALDIKDNQQKLNQQKSDQINEQKTNDLQRKTDEANAKLELAKQALTSKDNNLEKTIQAHKDIAAAVEERHKLEKERMQHDFEVTSAQHQQTIDALQKKVDQAGHKSTTTTLSPDGTSKNVTTDSGTPGDTVQVTGKDNKTYTIPKNKLNDTDADGTPHWKPIGGDDAAPMSDDDEE